VTLLLDAGVVVKWFVRENGTEAALRLFALDAVVVAQG
jgi:predicted nucleic acid-binding protein